MSSLQYVASNFGNTTLAGSLTALSTSFTVYTGQGSRLPVINDGGTDNNQYTQITLQKTDGTKEIVNVVRHDTGSDSCTIGVPGTVTGSVSGRAQDGTSATTWAIGDVVSCRPTASLMEEAVNLGAKIDASDAKTAIHDDDTFGVSDSEASALTKKTTWANIKSLLTTLFNTLYLPLAGGTLTGNLTVNGHVTLGAGKTLVYEGTTDDAHELTVSGGEPTADRTQTHRDMSGYIAMEANDYTAATPAVGDYIHFSDSSDSNLPKKSTIAEALALLGCVPVRQTVLSGPVDSAGLSAFVGATGSTTVTATGTLKATAAAGGDANYVGSIVNPSWTGLSSNGTMYLYLEISAAGVVSTGSTTLEPTYQLGGSYSTASGQHTYNIQEGTMKAGNGASASQVYRVFVGEVTVAGGSVTAITWYAIQGRYVSADTATLPGSAVHVSASHNIGCEPLVTEFYVRCTTTDAGYAVGDVIKPFGQGVSSGDFSPLNIVLDRLAVGLTTGDTSASIGARNKSTGARTGLTAASWSYFFTANRGW